MRAKEFIKLLAPDSILKGVIYAFFLLWFAICYVLYHYGANNNHNLLENEEIFYLKNPDRFSEKEILTGLPANEFSVLTDEIHDSVFLHTTWLRVPRSSFRNFKYLGLASRESYLYVNSNLHSITGYGLPYDSITTKDKEIYFHSLPDKEYDVLYIKVLPGISQMPKEMKAHLLAFNTSNHDEATNWSIVASILTIAFIFLLLVLYHKEKNEAFKPFLPFCIFILSAAILFLYMEGEFKPLLNTVSLKMLATFHVSHILTIITWAAFVRFSLLYLQYDKIDSWVSRLICKGTNINFVVLIILVFVSVIVQTVQGIDTYDKVSYPLAHKLFYFCLIFVTALGLLIAITSIWLSHSKSSSLTRLIVPSKIYAASTLLLWSGATIHCLHYLGVEIFSTSIQPIEISLGFMAIIFTFCIAHIYYREKGQKDIISVNKQQRIDNLLNEGKDRDIKPIPSVKQHLVSTKGKNYLFVIGINSYAHRQKLNNAVSDANEIKEVLINNYQFETDYTFELYDEQASRVNILNMLSEFEDKLTDQDNIIIFYAGHGSTNAKQTRSSWIPADAHTQADFIDSSIIRSYVESFSAHHVYLIVDSCFSGNMLNRSENFADKVEMLPSRRILTSGRNEVVSDGLPGTNSPFTKVILDFLKAQEASFPTSRLEQHVKENTPKTANQVPLSAHLPGMGDQGGEFVFHPKKYEEADWQKAQAKDFISGYKTFLDTYSDGKFHQLAKNRISELKENSEWEQAQLKNTISAYLDYKQRFPEGQFVSQAKEAIASIEEEALWKKVKKQDTFKAYHRYMEKFPEGKYVQTAVERLEIKYKSHKEPMEKLNLRDKTSLFLDSESPARIIMQKSIPFVLFISVSLIFLTLIYLLYFGL